MSETRSRTWQAQVRITRYFVVLRGRERRLESTLRIGYCRWRHGVITRGEFRDAEFRDGHYLSTLATGRDVRAREVPQQHVQLGFFVDGQACRLH